MNAKLEERSPRDEADRLAPWQKELIQTVLFLSALYRFFIDGTEAAQMALQELKSYGIQSFTIGTAEFAEGSEDLERGAKLAGEMVSSVKNDRVRAWVTSSDPFYQLIDEVERYVRRQ